MGGRYAQSGAVVTDAAAPRPFGGPPPWFPCECDHASFSYPQHARARYSRPRQASFVVLRTVMRILTLRLCPRLGVSFLVTILTATELACGGSSPSGEGPDAAASDAANNAPDQPHSPRRGPSESKLLERSESTQRPISYDHRAWSGWTAASPRTGRRPATRSTAASSISSSRCRAARRSRRSARR